MMTTNVHMHNYIDGDDVEGSGDAQVGCDGNACT